MDNKAVFDIKVSPKSSRSEIIVDASGKIKVYLNSPPVDGKANLECINIIAKKLKTAKSNISIEKGDHGKNKRISVSGMTLQDVLLKIKGED